MTEKKRKKWGWHGQVSPGFQRFVNCTVYGFGYAKAAVEKRHRDFAAARTFETQHESKSAMKTVLVWFNAFTTGAERRRKELRAELKAKQVTAPQGS